MGCAIGMIAFSIKKYHYSKEELDLLLRRWQQRFCLPMMIEQLKQPKCIPCTNEESCFNCKTTSQDDHCNFELHAIRIEGNPKLQACECQMCQEDKGQEWGRCF